MEFEVRPATASDAESITDVHLRAWRETYSGMLPESVFAARDAHRQRRVEVWREIILGHAPFGEERAYVAEVDHRVVGWATASDGLDDDAPHPNQLDGLYVLAEMHGSGIGRALLEAAVGVETGAYVWALDREIRAVAFYRRMGFEPDGAKKSFTTDGASLPEQRLVRPPR
jgi:GNAT superfamily N-acetyltransferase